MTIAKLSTQDTQETIIVAGRRIDVRDIEFSVMPRLGSASLTWLSSRALTLFSSPSQAIALIKIGEVRTEGLVRKEAVARSYLVGIVAGVDSFQVCAAALCNGDSAVTSALHRNIPLSEESPEAIIEGLRVVAEHAIAGVHDGHSSVSWADLDPAPAVTKAAHLMTSRSRPLGVALLMSAPAGAWYAQLGAKLACVRPNERVSHVFLVEHPTVEMMAALHAWSSDDATPQYPFVPAAQLATFSNNERDAWQLLLADGQNALKLISSGNAAAAHKMIEHILDDAPPT